MQILDEALESAVKLSRRYIPARQLPDKSVSLLDTACARVAISQHSVPPQVEDSRRRIAALETELKIIDKERSIGIETSKREAVALPLLKRAGLILDRRSETLLRGWTGSTMYYFKIEFEDGVVGEFAYAGRGAHEDPYVNNLPGVAYTRGPTLLHFKHVRV